MAEANQAKIAMRAGLFGFGSVSVSAATPKAIADDGGWDYEQAVCPALPNHLILEYSRGNGEGDVSLFSAVIARGSGAIRVLPVRRRGYSLWTPSASNALTLNDFNRIVQEEGQGVSPDWLSLSLCYAALAGGHLRAALLPSGPAAEFFPLLAPAKLTVGAGGGAEVQLVDVARYTAPHSKATAWVLSFTPNGRLIKVRHSVAAEISVRTLPASGKTPTVKVLGQVLPKAGPTMIP